MTIPIFYTTTTPKPSKNSCTIRYERLSVMHVLTGNDLPSDFTIGFYYLFDIVFHHEIQVPFIFDYWFINVKHHVWATYANPFLSLHSQEDVVENTKI